MKKVILKHGAYGALILLFFNAIQIPFEGKITYEIGEVIGYTSIVISLTFIYFAIKHYRDNVNNGNVTLGKSIIIGVLVTLIVSLTFGIINYVYVEVINPDFTTEYYTYYIEKYKAELPMDEFQEKLKEMETQKEFFTNSFISSIVMFSTVFIIGFIISLISGLILQRKN